jgi:hypothetical protein
MALHNFICDSALKDYKFDKCNEDEEYMYDTKEDEGQQEAQTSDDDVHEEANAITMNTIRDNIVNALVSGG